METIINTFKDFINLAPRQKVNLFYALIISGLCYVIYHREKTFEANYKIWKSDYDILTTRCDTVSFYYQKKIDAMIRWKIYTKQMKKLKTKSNENN